MTEKSMARRRGRPTPSNPKAGRGNVNPVRRRRSFDRDRRASGSTHTSNAESSTCTAKVRVTAQRRSRVSGLTLSSSISLPSILPRVSATAYAETKQSYSVHDNMTTDGERSYESHSKLYLYITAYDVPLSNNAMLKIRAETARERRRGAHGHPHPRPDGPR